LLSRSQHNGLSQSMETGSTGVPLKRGAQVSWQDDEQQESGQNRMNMELPVEEEQPQPKVNTGMRCTDFFRLISEQLQFQ
jgi:hypothetical protein